MAKWNLDTLLQFSTDKAAILHRMLLTTNTNVNNTRICFRVATRHQGFLLRYSNKTQIYTDIDKYDSTALLGISSPPLKASSITKQANMLLKVLFLWEFFIRIKWFKDECVNSITKCSWKTSVDGRISE